MSISQLVRLLKLVRRRLKHYDKRSKYLRELKRTGGYQLVHAHGVTWDRTTRTWIRIDVHQAMRQQTRTTPNRSDTGACKAFTKVRQLNKVVESVVPSLLRDRSARETALIKGSDDASSQLSKLDALIELEAELLKRSHDPRPIVMNKPFLIIFTSIPSDPMSRDPDPDQPLLALGGHRPSELYTPDEIRADREALMRSYQERGLAPPMWLENFFRAGKGMGTLDGVTPGTRGQRCKNPRVTTYTDRAATISKRVNGPSAATGEGMISKEVADRRFVEEFLMPSRCERCEGRGYLLAYRSCPDCTGAVEYLRGYAHLKCQRCRGDGVVAVRGDTCRICGGKGVLDNSDL